MKKNRINVMLLSVLMVFALAIPTFAAQIPGIDIPDKDPSTDCHDIELSQAFSPEKLTRTVTIDGKEQTDVILAVRTRLGSYIKSYADGYNRNKDTYSSFQEYIEIGLSSFARELIMGYPAAELVSINGVPWQKTEWAEYFEGQLDYFADFLPDEDYPQDSQAETVTKNPIYNGLSEEIDKGLSLAEAAKKGEKLQGTVTPTPVGENITLTMTLNNPTYTVKTKEGTVSKTLDVAPFAKSGVTLVPVRGVFESFEAKVEWLPKTKEVRVTKGDDLILLKLNSKTATVNGEAVKLLQAATITGGRTMIPLRFISENIGYNVDYVSKTKQIIITD